MTVERQHSSERSGPTDVQRLRHRPHGPRGRRASRADWPVLRMENLDTDLPLPPEAIPETVSGLEHAGGQQLAPVHRRPRPARRDRRLHSPSAPATATTPSARSSSPAAARRRSSTCCSPPSIPATRCCSPTPRTRASSTASRLAGGVPRLVPYRVRGRRVAARPRRLRRGRGRQAPAIAVLMSPSMPSGAVLTARRVGGGLRRRSASTTCRCSTTPRWSGCCSTAARSCTRCTSTAWPSAR